MPTVTETRRHLKGIKGHVAVAIWCREDVIERAKVQGIQLGEKAADDILDYLDRKQDASLGINWDTLDCFIDIWKDDHPHYRRCEPEGEDDE